MSDFILADDGLSVVNLDHVRTVSATTDGDTYNVDAVYSDGDSHRLASEVSEDRARVALATLQTPWDARSRMTSAPNIDHVTTAITSIEDSLRDMRHVSYFLANVVSEYLPPVGSVEDVADAIDQIKLTEDRGRRWWLPGV